MARSSGRAAVVAALCALVYASWVQLQLAGFVNASGSASSRALRSRVSLAATSPEVEAALKDFQLKKWAAEKLAGEGSPLAAAAAGRAQQAEAAYNAAKAAADGKTAPAAPVAVAPVAAAPAQTSAVSAKDLTEAKEKMDLMTWAAKKLASEGSPAAAQMQVKAQQAVAAYEALKAAKEGGAAAPVAAAPVAAAPLSAAAVAGAAPVAAGGASATELAEVKKQVDLLIWAANKLAAEASPQAANMKAKAQQATAAYEALKQKEMVAR